jgi:hypothetical protein
MPSAGLSQSADIPSPPAAFAWPKLLHGGVPGNQHKLWQLSPSNAAFSAALLAGEPFGLREAAGCLLILAAGALEGAAELRPARRPISSLPPGAPHLGGDLDRRPR